MAKEKTVYVCTNCGYESPKWAGKCPSCGQWNTFTEEVVRKETPVAKHVAHGIEAVRTKPQRLHEITSSEELRIDMKDDELNRVLGGGLVEGSLTLREINPHPANRAPPARLESALCIGRRKRTPTETPCRPHPASGRNAIADSLRNIVGANLHPHQKHGSRPGHHRLYPDHIDRSHRLLTRKHCASARMFSRHPEVCQRDP